MGKRKKSTLLLMGALFFCASLPMGCSYENEEELFNLGPCADEVSFAAEIRPLINANCAISGCHLGNPNLNDYSTAERIIDHAANIRQVTGNRSMPPAATGRSLSPEEINKIACWVDQGSKDN